MLNITFSKAPFKDADAAILCFYEDKTPSSAVSALNYEFHGYLDHALEKNKSFTGKYGETDIPILPEGSTYDYAVLLGCGKKNEFDKAKAENLGGKLAVALKGKSIEHIEFYADNDVTDVSGIGRACGAWDDIAVLHI